MLTVAISSSDDIEIPDALAHIISDCKRQLAGEVPKAGILLTSVMDTDFSAILAQVNLAFPGICLIGCTTDGEVVPGDGFIQDSVALLLFASNDVQFASSIALDVSKESGASIAPAFKEGEGKLGSSPAIGLVLPDGLSTIGTPLDKAIQLATADRFPVFGGTAGDNFLFTGTYQFHGDQVYTDALPVLLLGGNLHVDSKICMGTNPIGKRFAITSFDKNVLHTIDNEPAAKFYEKHFGNYTKEAEIAQFPLAVYEGDSETYYLRDPLTIDKDTGTVTFIGNFEHNSWARLTAISKDDLLRSAEEANQHVLKSNGDDGPDLIVIFSCTSRKHTLGSRAHLEFSSLLSDERNIPFFGFYCYGEIGPILKNHPVLFHNDCYIAVSLTSPVD